MAAPTSPQARLGGDGPIGPAYVNSIGAKKAPPGAGGAFFSLRASIADADPSDHHVAIVEVDAVTLDVAVGQRLFIPVARAIELRADDRTADHTGCRAGCKSAVPALPRIRRNGR